MAGDNDATDPELEELAELAELVEKGNELEGVEAVGAPDAPVTLPEGWTPQQFWKYAGELEAKIKASVQAIVDTASPEGGDAETLRARLQDVQRQGKELLRWMAEG